MTITLHWWVLPAAILVFGTIIGFAIAGQAGDYDFMTPIVGVTIIVVSWATAIALTIGKLFL